MGEGVRGGGEDEVWERGVGEMEGRWRKKAGKKGGSREKKTKSEKRVNASV